MDINERNRKIKELYDSEEMKMEEIGALFNISKMRISQILTELGISAREVRLRREAKQTVQIKSLIAAHPELAVWQISDRLNISTPIVKRIIKDSEIKRDHKFVMSNARIETLRGSRVKLTKELLFHLYWVEMKSTEQIGEMLDYHRSTITAYLKRLGIEARSGGAVKKR